VSHRTATLYIRITTEDDKRPYCRPVYLSKGRLKPLYPVVNSKPEHHPEGVYHIRFGTDAGKQTFVPVGNDPYVALDKLAEKQRWLRDREHSVPYVAPDTPKPESTRLRVDAAVEQYFKNLQSQGKDRKTIRAYKLAIEEFRQSCTKKFVDEIRKQDLIDFMGWLRTRSPKLRKDGTPRKPRRSGDPLASSLRELRSHDCGGLTCTQSKTALLRGFSIRLCAKCVPEFLDLMVGRGVSKFPLSSAVNRH
jgi:hypothetical protein